MTATVYLIRLNGEPKYVGFTQKTIKQRWVKHCWDAENGRKTILCNSIRKYGKKSFTTETIFGDEDDDYTLKVMEPKFIKEYNTFMDAGGYNMTLGGDGLLGSKQHNYCRKETNRKLSDEHRHKLSLSHIGRKFSEEHRLKLSHAAKNRRKPNSF